MLRGLARHWWQALALWIVGTAALAVLIYLRAVPTYQASALLQVEPAGVNPFTSGRDGSLDSYMRTQVELIRSPNVLSTASYNPKVATGPTVSGALDAEVALLEALQVTVLPNSYLLRVSASSKSAADAANIVNAVVDAFLQLDTQWSAAKTEKQIANLESYANELELKVEEQQQTLTDLAMENGIPPILMDRLLRGDAAAAAETEGGDDDRYTVGLKEYASRVEELMEVEFDEIEARQMLEDARLEAAAIPDPRRWLDRQVEQQFLAAPEVQQIRAELRELNTRKVDLGRRLRNSQADPAYRALERDEAALRRRYDELWAVDGAGDPRGAGPCRDRPRAAGHQGQGRARAPRPRPTDARAADRADGAGPP